MRRRHGSMVGGALVAILVAGAIGAHDVPAQTEGEPGPSEEAAEAYEAAKAYGFERKEELVDWLERQLSALDEEMAAVREAAENAGERARSEWPRLMEELEERRAAAAEQLERLQAASADVWEGVKRAAASAMEELDEAVDDADRRLD